MGMFERLGEKVERFKQEAAAARDESADYRCRNCGAGFYSEEETCPECGSAEIERVDAPAKEETDETADESDAPEAETENAATETNEAGEAPIEEAENAKDAEESDSSD